MWRILIPATLVGLAREYFLRKGWIPPDPVTKEEKRKYTERTIILSVIYSAISLFLLCSWLRWFVPGLWEQYFVVYTVFGACCAIFPGMLVASIHVRVMEQNPKHRIKKSTGPPRGWWREFMDEGRNPKIK